MIYNSSRALQLLRLCSGLTQSSFREGQEEAIRHIVEGRGRLLVVQKTGWGKPLMAGRRDDGCGVALPFTPKGRSFSVV